MAPFFPLIPSEFRNHPFLDKIDINIDAALNAPPINNTFHLGPHNNYGDAMRRILNELEDKGLSSAQEREVALKTITDATAPIPGGRSLRTSLDTISIDDWYHSITPSQLSQRMHTSLDDMPRLRLLVNEVSSLLDSPSFLTGASINEHTLTFGDSRTYRWKRVPHHEYTHAIDARNEDSSYLKLMRALSPNEEAYSYYDSYAPMVGVESLTRSIEFVYNRLQSLPAARHLAEECHRARVRDEEVSGFFDHIANTVSNHLHSIAHGRIVTLGRRFALGEVLFDAYRNGHMPFGKDPDTGHILCIAGRDL